MKIARRILFFKESNLSAGVRPTHQTSWTKQHRCCIFTCLHFSFIFQCFNFLLQLFSFSPKLSDGPSLVYVNVFVRSFSKIDDVKMVQIDFISYVRFLTSFILRCVSDFVKVNIFSVQEYSFQVTLRQQWNDKRLRFEELLKAKGVGEGTSIVCGLFWDEVTVTWFSDFFRMEKLGHVWVWWVLAISSFQKKEHLRCCKKELFF